MGMGTEPWNQTKRIQGSGLGASPTQVSERMRGQQMLASTLVGNWKLQCTIFSCVALLGSEVCTCIAAVHGLSALAVVKRRNHVPRIPTALSIGWRWMHGQQRAVVVLPQHRSGGQHRLARG